MSKKYVVDKEKSIEWNGITLYRIKALKKIKNSNPLICWVNPGEYGGYVQSEQNLSQEDNCWIFENAKVYESAKVIDNAVLTGEACLYGESIISGNSLLLDRCKVFGSSHIKDNSVVSSDVKICNTILAGDCIAKYGANIKDSQLFCTKVFGESFIESSILFYSKVISKCKITLCNITCAYFSNSCVLNSSINGKFYIRDSTIEKVCLDLDLFKTADKQLTIKNAKIKNSDDIFLSLVNNSSKKLSIISMYKNNFDSVEISLSPDRKTNCFATLATSILEEIYSSSKYEKNQIKFECQVLNYVKNNSKKIIDKEITQTTKIFCKHLEKCGSLLKESETKSILDSLLNSFEVRCSFERDLCQLLYLTSGILLSQDKYPKHSSMLFESLIDNIANNSLLNLCSEEIIDCNAIIYTGSTIIDFLDIFCKTVDKKALPANIMGFLDCFNKQDNVVLLDLV